MKRDVKLGSFIRFGKRSFGIVIAEPYSLFQSQHAARRARIWWLDDRYALEDILTNNLNVILPFDDPNRKFS
jgi:hypothetical protein